MGKQQATTTTRPRNIMSQSTYQTIVLAARPKASIIPNETFSIKSNPIVTAADLKDGQVLVETLYLSLDPAMRSWLNGLPRPRLCPPFFESHNT